MTLIATFPLSPKGIIHPKLKAFFMHKSTKLGDKMALCNRLNVMQLINHSKEPKTMCGHPCYSAYQRLMFATTEMVCLNVSIAKDLRNPVHPVKQAEKCRIS